MKGAALVIGGSRGLGLSISRLLIERHYTVHVWSRTPPRQNTGVAWRKLDLEEHDAVMSMPFPDDIETVFYVAARGHFMATPRVFDFEKLQSVFRVNVFGLSTILTRLLEELPLGSRFCYVSSLTALLPSGPWWVYGSSKAAADHIVRSLRPVAAERQISMTVCFPGALNTSFHQDAGTKAPEYASGPDEVALSLVQAVVDRHPYFIAEMDKAIIETEIDIQKIDIRANQLFPFSEDTQ